MTSAGLIRRSIPCALLAGVVALLTATTAPASNTMAVQADGRIVLAGASSQPAFSSGIRNRPAIVRFTPDGRLDPGFGAHGGVVDFRETPSFVYSAVGVTSSAVFAGYGELGGGYRIDRFEADGDVDPDYGVDGVATISAPLPPLSTDLTTILPLADGSVIAGGDAREERVGFSQGVEFAHRLGAEGSFMDEVGRVQGSSADIGGPSGADLVRGEDGSLTTALTLTGGSGDWRPFVARFSPGGFDPSFGGAGGLVPLPKGGGGPGGPALAPYPGGGFVVSYWTGRPAVARISAAGAADPSFGEDGVATLPFGESSSSALSAVAAQPDGKVVVAGNSLEPCPAPTVEHGCWKVLVARFTADGDIDTSFGEDGVVHLSRHADDPLQPVGVDVAALGDCSTLVSAVPDFNKETEFFLARLDPSGKLDPSFGGGGTATATPCQGTLEQRRDAGCLAHARATLRASGLARGRPRGVLRIAGDNLLDPITEAVLVLPRALRGVTKRTKRVRAFGAPRVPLGKRVDRGRIAIRGGFGHPTIAVTVPPGVLRRVHPVDPKRKLRFQLRVSFADGSGQRLRLRVRP